MLRRVLLADCIELSDSHTTLAIEIKTQTNQVSRPFTDQHPSPLPTHLHHHNRKLHVAPLPPRSRRERSVKAAERLGFRLEGIIRWHRILPEGKEGKRVEGDADARGPGRDTAMLSICWDDWRDGVRERVRSLGER